MRSAFANVKLLGKMAVVRQFVSAEPPRLGLLLKSFGHRLVVLQKVQHADVVPQMLIKILRRSCSSPSGQSLLDAGKRQSHDAARHVVDVPFTVGQLRRLPLVDSAAKIHERVTERCV